MEDSIDMNDMAALRPQNFLFGCELKADKKEYTFKVDNDESEHQLSLRTISLGAVAKDDLHIVEAEGMNYEGKQLKIVLASLRQSVQPTVSLGGFEITPPVTLRLKSGSGPVYVSGQHLVALEDLGSSDEEEDDEEEEENTEATKNAKRPTTSTSKVPQKKLKLEEEEEDDDDDEEDDDDDLDDEDEEEEEDDDDDEDETPVKKRAPVTKVKSAHKSNHNGKATEPSTPAKLSKTPEQKGKQEAKPQTPKTPKTPLSYEQMKERLQSTAEKGMNLPKVEARFINYVKNCFRTDDKEVIDNLWNWRKTMKDLK